ncbi:hypothetical protein FALBO_12417 [Fusarium albosuccineum]|uniref:Uncharacterized protein n=1 Tax=Fusarium albosuccineum TaxID=1237068 RepID=A0A8H4L366_9HYPO|nr:hypothetical protein FALBO_12417 [Fusarium albosuccineum]
MYFFRLATSQHEDGSSSTVKLDAARRAACIEFDENLTLLVRLLTHGNIDKGEMGEHVQLAQGMKDQTTNRSDPVSLGAVYRFARITWVYRHTQAVACDSVLLQIVMYLYEKQRLQDPNIETGDDDESLVGSLLEDRRIAPLLLQDGQPQSASECIIALRKWCHVPPSHGETVEWIDNRFSPAKSLHGLLNEIVPQEGITGVQGPFLERRHVLERAIHDVEDPGMWSAAFTKFT